VQPSEVIGVVRVVIPMIGRLDLVTKSPQGLDLALAALTVFTLWGAAEHSPRADRPQPRHKGTLSPVR
jgi:hypothetical protein